MENFLITDEKILQKRIDKVYTENLIDKLAFTKIKKTVISDLDDTLVFSLFKVVALAVLNKDLEEEYLDIDRYIEREGYFFQEYLKDSKLTNDGKELFDKYYSGDFYDDLFPNKIAEILADLNNSDKIKLVIISSTYDSNKASKEKFIKKFFPNASYFLLGMKESKADCINSNNLSDYVTYFEDNLDIVHEVIKKTYSLGKEFIMPHFGHNCIEKVSPEMLKDIVNYQAEVKYLPKQLFSL
jgi:hypothetical protein